MGNRRSQNSPGDNILDIRSVIDRFEELEELCGDKTLDGESDPELDPTDDDKEDYEIYKEFLDNVSGNGGDHQWRGDWYPVTLILDSYFPEYAEGFAEDIGVMSKSNEWPFNCIDWDQATRQLKQDYSSTDFGEYTYWYQG